MSDHKLQGRYDCQNGIFVGDIKISTGEIEVSEALGATPQFTLACISTGGSATTVRDSTTATQGTTETVLNDPVTA